MTAFGPELSRSQAARQEHERRLKTADSLVESTKTLGRSAVTDIYTAVRFSRTPDSRPISKGIVRELDGPETMLFLKLAIKDRIQGPERLDQAIATYNETLNQIETVELDSEAVTFDTVE